MQPPDNDVHILIPAAGMGERLGLGPKALLRLKDIPLVVWVVQKARKITNNITISAPADYKMLFEQLCPDCQIIVGGSTRQESIKKLVATSSCEIVLIHDVARPFASVNLFYEVIAATKKYGCAGAFLQPEVPTALIEKGKVIQSFQHHQIGLFQAPQAVYRKDLLAVIDLADAQQWQEQSTMQLMLRAGKNVHCVPGEKYNIKLTTPEDWQIAQALTGHLL